MFKLFLVTPEKKIVMDQELEDLVLPAFKGELNILPGHAPMMTTLEPGILRYKLKSGETGRFAISWGYCQVSAEGVRVLAETAMTASEIDVAAAKSELDNDELRLGKEHLSDTDWETLHREIGRLKAEIQITSS